MSEQRICSIETVRELSTLEDVDISTPTFSLHTSSSIGIVTLSPDCNGILKTGHLLQGRWKIIKNIANGGFGEVYEGQDLRTSSMIAIKVEHAGRKESLKMEVGVLKKLQGHDFVCKYFGYGRAERYNFMVMELQGKNLNELKLQMPNRCFSLGTTLLIGYQILEAICSLHQIGFLHRDIKPDNFAVGYLPENKRKIVMLDFGLARQYQNSEGKIKYARINAAFRGTPRYASVNAHKGKELGRHDDLWSIFYMLSELLNGILPWKDMKCRKKIGKMKEELDHRELITHFPKEFRKFLYHLEGLNYYDKPDYDKLKSILTKCMDRCKEIDGYDWERKSSISAISYVEVNPRDYEMLFSSEPPETIKI